MNGGGVTEGVGMSEGGGVQRGRAEARRVILASWGGPLAKRKGKKRRDDTKRIQNGGRARVDARVDAR